MITFPSNPTEGQTYVASNGATYTWSTNRWNSRRAIGSSSAIFSYEGGDSTTWSDANNNPTDLELDGGTS